MAGYDVTLDGSEFMLVPKTYKLGQAGFQWGDSRISRSALNDLGRGAGFYRPERDKGRDGGLATSQRARSAGAPYQHLVKPAPVQTLMSGTFATTDPKITLASPDYVYTIAGPTLYRWPRSGSPTSRKALSAAVVDACWMNGSIFLAYGSAADVGSYDDASNSLTASVLGAGIQATKLATYSRGLALTAPGFPANLHYWFGNGLGYHKVWALDGEILSMCVHDDRLIVATVAGLYTLTGGWEQFTDPPAPEDNMLLRSWGRANVAMQYDDDFAWMTVHAGRLYAWQGRAVRWYDEAADLWRAIGITADSTQGAAVAGDWLIVSVTRGSSHEVWGLYGSGWWLLDASTTDNRRWPASLGDGRIATYQSGSGTWWSYDLVADAGADSFVLVSPLLDAGLPDRRKHWRSMGVELLRPDGQDVGVWSVALDYSLDAGLTWTTADTLSATEQQQSLHADVGADATHLQLRVIIWQTSGNAPWVAALWAEHETINESVRRRTWSFDVRATDTTITRTGAAPATLGQAIREALWDTFSAAEAVEYIDVDGSAYTVRLQQLREDWPAPSDYPTLGAQSVLHVTLVEV